MPRPRKLPPVRCKWCGATYEPRADPFTRAGRCSCPDHVHKRDERGAKPRKDETR